MDIFELNGEKIREFRESLNWTREFLSEKSDIPYGTIKQIETGATKNPGIETLLSLLKAMAPHIPKLNSNATRAESVLRIINSLPSLSDDQLETFASLLETAASDRTALSKSK